MCCLYCTLAIPSTELVKHVRELYQRNSSDVRFLIPVLHGLQKVRDFIIYVCIQYKCVLYYTLHHDLTSILCAYMCLFP